MAVEKCRVLPRLADMNDQERTAACGTGEGKITLIQGAKEVLSSPETFWWDCSVTCLCLMILGKQLGTQGPLA